jgi:FAD/FMN-containing dehydrogenase/Fe-S oxidoreductase
VKAIIDPSAKSSRAFEVALRRRVRGDVAFDDATRGMYATDASIYQQMPSAVVAPRDAEDVRAAVEVARAHKVPITGRGGGTSLAGQTVGFGLVLDFSKYMNGVLEVNAAERWARVQPGLIRDHLNDHLRGTGLIFAPETSTSSRAAIGGMIGNNSSGMMSIRYGRTSEHVLEVTALLADGSVVRLGANSTPSANPRESELRASLLALGSRHRGLIEARWPRVLRRVGGYSLDELLKPDPNFGTFLSGSEGTLAIMLDAKVRLVESPRAIAMMAVHFGDFIGSLRTVPAIVAHDPLSVELIDRRTVELSRANAATAELCDFIQGTPAALFSIECTGDTFAEAQEKLRAIQATIDATGAAYHVHYAADDAERIRMTELRKAGLGVTIRMIGDRKPVSFIEDAAVPVEHLADYMTDLLEITARESLDWVVYGHASVGVLHFKPVLNLKDPADLAKMERVSSAAMERVRHYGGSWSGEHGDGIIRGARNADFWGAEMIEVFRETKRIFDPEGLLNPGKIFDTPGLTDDQRYGPRYGSGWDATWFHFRESGGFQGAVEMCNGTGACRKIGAGTMCPSYMASRDEEHSTRGRANALRLAMSGQLGPRAMESDRLNEVLDLCLECKACKTECPSNVDMSRMKSEVLAHRRETNGTTARDWLFAHTPDVARKLAGPLAPLINGVMRAAPTRAILGRMGLAAKRTPPKFASRTFESWFNSRPQRRRKTARVVAIYVDTYTNCYEPQIGVWMTRLLEHFGCRVVLAKPGCCGRALISKGFLREARARAESTMRGLEKFASRSIPVVVLEPSCFSALTDDGPDLLVDEELAKRVLPILRPAESLLAELLAANDIKRDANTEFHVHGHCHQKSLWGTRDALRALRLCGRVHEIPSGCCGMAGSFGYETEHAEFSMKIGEDRLFPALRKAPRHAIIVANGFSCRHQISDGTGRRAMHIAEALGRAILKK